MNFLTKLGKLVWGAPLLFLILGAGILLTVLLRGIQLRRAPSSLSAMFRGGGGEGALSPFQSSCVALAATIGTGNIIGVVTAIWAGGPGAIFWMWLSTLLCIPLRFAEGYLGCKYKRAEKGGVLSGAFLYIERSKGPFAKGSAMMYAFFCMMSALLGMGTMVQSRSIADAVVNLAGASGTPSGFYLAAGVALLTATLAAIAIAKGVNGIANTTSLLVPFMLILYCAFGIGAICYFGENLLPVLREIVVSAFHPAAAIGGVGGAALIQVMRAGVSRGVFTNESGLGSGAFAAGASRGTPFQAGLAQMGVVFIDTIVVCTITALAVLCSGAHLSTSDPVGAVVSALSFGGRFQLGGFVVPFSLILFAFTSALGVYYFGVQSLRYLTGGYGASLYNYLYVLFLVLGGLLPMGAVWQIADIFNGLLGFIHIPALLTLTPVLIAGVRAAQKELDKKPKIR